MTVNHQTARYLAGHGLFILPCNPDTKVPLLPQWPIRATNKPSGVDYFWQKYGVGSMPGIALGASGLLAIDIDVKSGIDGHQGIDAIFDEHGADISRCPITRTTSGGHHIIFRQQEGRAPLGNSPGALPRGIDVRGAGGMIIAPGAIKSDGTFYESEPGWPELAVAYASGTIPEVPTWLVAVIEARPRGPSEDTPPPIASGDKSAWVAEGLSREARALAATAEGGRNHALYRFVCTFAGHAANGWTTRDEIYAAAWWACEQNGYLDSRAANDGPKQFDKSFGSGWRWGYAHPTCGPRERLTADISFTTLRPRLAARS